MTNQQIADVLHLTSQLLELHGENPFKIKAYQSAVGELEKFPKEVSVILTESQSFELPFTKNTIDKFKEIIQTGTLKTLEDLLQRTPQGVVEMLRIRGLGPKKIQTIWLQLGIDNLGDLLHACYENRLKDVKGFGQKTQENIKKSIEFYFSSKGKLHIHKAFHLAEWIKTQFPFPVYETGVLLTWDNYLDSLEFVTAYSLPEVKSVLSNINFLITQETDNALTAKNTDNLILKFYFCQESELYKLIFKFSSNDLHNQKIGFQDFNCYESLDSIYKGFPYLILPQHRYHEDCFRLYQESRGEWVHDKDIKGLVHCHSTYSDGKNSLLEMVKACIDMGYEYMVITDHSQSAFYANGLSPARLEVQWNEIDKLNAQFPRFKIFRGIESDILVDGSLDYEESVLERLDLVIASIHSQFKMDIKQATQRLIKAIENPYTRILGHVSGRLLLIREGYPVEYQKIIDACAQNKVAIEMNANPYRLDLDWKWLRKAVDQGVDIFINPDAHSIEGIRDVRWGAMMANKAFLNARDIVNCKEQRDFESWIEQKKR